MIRIDEIEYKILFWDTAGQERFRSLPKKYFQNADGIFILYDVTNEESFQNLNIWLANIKDFLGDGGNKLTTFLIGNKIDLNDRVISRSSAETFANNLGLKYYETSAKLNLNIHEVISRMILECHMCISKISDYFIKSSNSSQTICLDNKEEKLGQNSICCAGGNNKKNAKNEKPKLRESLETIKSSENPNDISELK